jgi:hypothetical protein
MLRDDSDAYFHPLLTTQFAFAIPIPFQYCRRPFRGILPTFISSTKSGQLAQLDHESIDLSTGQWESSMLGPSAHQLNHHAPVNANRVFDVRV